MYVNSYTIIISLGLLVIGMLLYMSKCGECGKLIIPFIHDYSFGVDYCNIHKTCRINHIKKHGAYWMGDKPEQKLWLIEVLKEAIDVGEPLPSFIFCGYEWLINDTELKDIIKEYDDMVTKYVKHKGV